MKIRRSMLLVPANIPKFVEGAKRSEADMVILDMQDAIANEDRAKEQAREAAVAAIRSGGFRAREVSVRVNAPSSRWFLDDMTAVIRAGVDNIMLTHTLGPGDVYFAERVVRALRSDKEVDIRVEIDTPGALAGLEETARQSTLVTGISLGASDYSMEMWMPIHGPAQAPSDTALVYARSRIVTIARSKGWNAADTSRPVSREPEDVRASMTKLRQFGFDGCLLLRPTNVEMANEIFGVTPDELAWAKNLVGKWQALNESDWDKTYRTIDGVGVFKPTFEYASRILAYQATIDGDARLLDHFHRHGFVSEEYLEEQGIRLA